MPMYQLSRTHAHDDIEAIEQRGERVTFVTPDGPVLIVVTEHVERRPDFSAAYFSGVEKRA